MDVGSGSGYPAGALSNFSPHPFVFEDILCNSMEGLLQAFKFSNPAMQVHICTLVGAKAKRAGSKKNWKTDQTLYWKDKSFKRDSQEYQDLLDRAYAALSQNESFKKALLASRDANLTHSIGRTKIQDTVLTVREFCGRLMRIRKELQNKEKEEKNGFEY